MSADRRQIVAASPGYLAEAGTPLHPRDLTQHRRIGQRPSADVAPYRLESTEDGREFDVAVEPAVTTNDMGVVIRMAVPRLA